MKHFSLITTVVVCCMVLIFATAISLPPQMRVRAAGELYAAPAAQGSGDCSSWANTCTLQTALTTAGSGSEIWVKAGVHKPTSEPDNRDASFTLKSGVSLFGGFNGTETSREQRNWQLYQTILSGDIDSNDVNTDGNFIAESTSDLVGANSKHIVRISGVDGTAVLDGFVITAGSESSGNGAGFYLDSDSVPVLRNLVIIGNSASSAGGMWIENSGPALSNVSFINNYAGYRGGAIRDVGSHKTSITNAVFIGNGAADHGGAIETGYGRSYNGGLTITNAVFWKNYSSLNVAGIFSDNSLVDLNNVTFAGNISPNDPGSIYSYQSFMNFNNVIMWADASPASQAFMRDSYYYSPVTISSSDIQGCGSSAAWNTDCATDGGGNIQTDPLFLDLAAGNLRLSSTSPAIDAGNNSLVPPGITTDLDGNPRLVDVPSVIDTGIGTPPIVDMGAYEAFIDTTPPIVLSITRLDPSPTNASRVRFLAAFSEPVFGVSIADFVAAGSGTSGATILSVNGSPTTYLLSLDTGSGDGTLRADIPITASITDLMGNILGGLPFSSGEVYTIDRTAPTVQSITRAGTSPTVASDLVFNVTFSEAVSGVSSADFSLFTTGDVSGVSVTDVSGSGAAYTVTVNRGSGVGSLRLDVPSTASAADAVGNQLVGLPYESGESYTIEYRIYLPLALKNTP